MSNRNYLRTFFNKVALSFQNSTTSIPLNISLLVNWALRMAEKYFLASQLECFWEVKKFHSFDSTVAKHSLWSFKSVNLFSVYTVRVSRENWRRLFGARRRTRKAKLNISFSQAFLARHGNKFEAQAQSRVLLKNLSRKFSEWKCRQTYKFIQHVPSRAAFRSTFINQLFITPSNVLWAFSGENYVSPADRTMICSQARGKLHQDEHQRCKLINVNADNIQFWCRKCVTPPMPRSFFISLCGPGERHSYQRAKLSIHAPI